MFQFLFDVSLSFLLKHRQFSVSCFRLLANVYCLITVSKSGSFVDTAHMLTEVYMKLRQDVLSDVFSYAAHKILDCKKHLSTMHIPSNVWLH